MDEQQIKAYMVHLEAAVDKMQGHDGDQKFLAKSALKLLQGFLINQSKIAKSLDVIAKAQPRIPESGG